MSKQEIATAKNALRQGFLAKRRALEYGVKRALDQKITSRLQSFDKWRNASSIFLFASLPDEIDTRPLIDLAWREGRLVGLPRIEDSRKGIMRFYQCENFSQLDKGPFSLWQPASTCPPLTELPDLLVLPGLAFDNKGGRLGYGKGFYDRYLAHQKLDVCFLLGLCYAFQLVDAVPQEKTDFPVNGICTDEGFLLQ